ncbi:MAG: hypothetical protein H8E94_03910, partial [Alphaproteobacteria bacterium]|nr:hypothetical protein [Alphaproteobacteria bacterium]
MDQQTEAEIIGAARNRDGEDAVTPVRLGPDDQFQFSCHRGVSCWNKCCHGPVITLTPADFLRPRAPFTFTA